ncbi:hypothetical protein Ciccas_002445 [Cichlidogyrus casuarinus]|uniref:Uncharacterized protein n=1 Tax=Cichlidogyrus casuarinus TaxID=1844966 RepID=A0ABD2QHK5_9PLAT
MIVPLEWKTKYKPICFHFSGTGDQNYARRRIFLANKLLEDGIGSLIIMNPYYSERKPPSQKGASLNYLTDLFVMGGALITESNTLLRWCDFHGYGPYVLHGISMGGFMASLCSQSSHRPISLVPCLSAATASCVFVDGVLTKSVDWPTLTKQYYDDVIFAKTIRPKLQPTVPERFNISKTLSQEQIFQERIHKDEKAIRKEILRDTTPVASVDETSVPLDV